jgi:hypothetical protein
MEHIIIDKIIPKECPIGCDDCTYCLNFGSVEDGMVRCYADEGITHDFRE